jgi:MFS family permease
MATNLRAWLKHNRFLVVFGLLASLMGTSVGIAKITASLYALELGANASQLGLIAGGQVVGTVLMSVPIGFMVDHYGPTRLFVIGSLLAGLVYAAVPLVASPGFLLGCVIAISFFMPLRFVSLNTVFFEQLRTLGEGKAGWYRGTHMSGMFLIGPLVAVALIGTAGYAGTWWAIAASFALTIAVCPIVFGRYARPARPRQRTGWRGALAELKLLTKDRELRQTCLVDFCVAGTTMYQNTFIVAIALQVMHLDAAHASAYVTGTGTAYVLTLFVAGGAASRAGSRSSYLTGFALTAAALVLQGTASTAAWLWPGVLLQGVGLGLLQITTLTSVARIGARLGQGKVSGVNLLVQPVGGLFGSAAGGLLAQYVGLQNVFFVFLPAFALLAAWQFRLKAAVPDAQPVGAALGS